jgi:ectoine hydroxylase-related dioxygenase (phytanoyl-CoA dioxygenase family)
MAIAEMTQPHQYETYRVSVEEYRRFRQQGFLVIKGLVPQADVDEMNEFMDDMLAGRKTVEGAQIMKNKGREVKTPDELLRIHMLHRKSPLHERFLLHPRILDGLEALIGPDVLALQSMLFFKQPGQPGQGYHQDSYYIPTFPDTLCGAWLALTEATLENGCLWYAVGSQNEPVYPDPNGMGAALTSNIGDLGTIENASAPDESVNGLSRVVRKYQGEVVPVLAEPGDVVYFGGHVVHWSYPNQSTTARRSFVGHYCNARSFVPWNHGETWEGESANYLHLLARGATHLPFAQPLYGTPCAANTPRPKLGEAKSMMGMPDGKMAPMPHGDEPDHKH